MYAFKTHLTINNQRRQTLPSLLLRSHMHSNQSSRPCSASGFRPSTSTHQTPFNVKLHAAVEKHGSFTNALASICGADFAERLVQLWSTFYDRCRFMDSRINPTGLLSWTEVKSVLSYLHLQKMATERCLRNLFSDLGMALVLIHGISDNFTGFSIKDPDNVVQVDYVAFVEEIKRSIDPRPTTGSPHGIKSGWSAERPRGKCQVFQFFVSTIACKNCMHLTQRAYRISKNYSMWNGWLLIAKLMM